MYRVTDLKTHSYSLLLAISMAVLGVAFSCSSSEITIVNVDGNGTPEAGSGGEINVADLDCSDLEEDPNRVGDAPLGPPPALPNIFTGTAYVNGKPAPVGEQLYVKLVTTRSRSVEIMEGGKFINIIHGPVSELDQGVDFQFCLGDPEGIAIKSNETFEFDGSEPFKESDVELNFPMLPSELSSQ